MLPMDTKELLLFVLHPRSVDEFIICTLASFVAERPYLKRMTLVTEHWVDERRQEQLRNRMRWGLVIEVLTVREHSRRMEAKRLALYEAQHKRLSSGK